MRRLSGFLVVAVLVADAGSPTRASAAARAGSAGRTAVAEPLTLPAVGATSEIGQLIGALDRLSVLGTALYLAAHPDDENTGVLAYLAQGKRVRTAYLSLTRGGGGQNLIGSERGELLGLLRTQELLAARAVDGAEQWFSRARDFGYSKSPDETFSIWQREEVLSDVVWVIRRLRPDIIITRFPTDADTHGHHTASAMLAAEAFRAAADPTRFPAQLTWVEPWQARRLLWNAWRPHLEQRNDKTTPLVEVDVGDFNPLLGKSYGEIAALSRSMHKCQGFGTAAMRGSQVELFEWVAGEPLAAGVNDLFAGIDISWSRVAGGDRVAALFQRARAEFDVTHPGAIVPLLVEALGQLEHLPPSPWVTQKITDTRDLIRRLAGLWVEATADRFSVAPGGELKVTTKVLSQSDVPIELGSVGLTFHDKPIQETRRLRYNQPITDDWQLRIPADHALSQPYWLATTWKDGLFSVPQQMERGRPEAPPALYATFTVRVGADRTPIDIVEPVLFRWADPVAGERVRSIEIVPPVSVRLDEPVYVFANGDARTVAVTVKSSIGREVGTVRLRLPDGFVADPKDRAFVLSASGATATVHFDVTPPKGRSVGRVAAVAVTEHGEYTRDLVRVEYPHIPIQTVYPVAESAVVRVDIGATDLELGYVMGAGDDVPQSLRQAGYRVTLLEDGDIAHGDLSRYRAIITGVRAYNTRPSLAQLHERLLEYAKAGGTLIVQYAVTKDLVRESLGPYPFTIGRDRVTDESAEVRFVSSSHPLLRIPNVLGPADFEGWVQERGLYFADTWDDRYETVFDGNDSGEKPTRGGLLFARYGKGSFVYTGYAWFRQLPAGVPGAYRIFANLIAGGRNAE